MINESGFYSKDDIKDGADLILNMLNWDIKKRFSAEQCINHPFFKEKGDEKGNENERGNEKGKENNNQ